MDHMQNKILKRKISEEYGQSTTNPPKKKQVTRTRPVVSSMVMQQDRVSKHGGGGARKLQAVFHIQVVPSCQRTNQDQEADQDRSTVDAAHGGRHDAEPTSGQEEGTSVVDQFETGLSPHVDHVSTSVQPGSVRIPQPGEL